MMNGIFPSPESVPLTSSEKADPKRRKPLGKRVEVADIETKQMRELTESHLSCIEGAADVRGGATYDFAFKTVDSTGDSAEAKPHNWINLVSVSANRSRPM